MAMEANKKELEEKLREAACFGDLDLLEDLIRKGVNVNSRNPVNGWTALHWAVHRKNHAAMSVLLKNGADEYILNNKAESPYHLATPGTGPLFLDRAPSMKEQPVLPITPNYLKNPSYNVSNIKSNNQVMSDSVGELVLKLRLAGEDPDFIEVELLKTELTINNLINVCCKELKIKSDRISKIRKLPNTLLRKDKDVQRLIDFQEVEVVLG